MQSINQVIAIQNSDRWQIIAQFEPEQLPVIGIVEPTGDPCRFERIRCKWLESIQEDLSNDYLLFEREVKKIAQENNPSGFQVSREGELLILTFGHNLDAERRMGVIGGILAAGAGGAGMFFGAPLILSAVAIGTGVQTLLYSAKTEKFSQEQLGKEAAKGVLTSLASSAVSGLAAARLVATFGNRVLAQMFCQAGTSALTNGIQQGLEKKEFSYRQLGFSAIAGSFGAACGAGAGATAAKLMGEAGSEMFKATLKAGCEGAANSGTACTVGNLLNEKKWSEGLLESTLIGGSVSACAAAAETKNSGANRGISEDETGPLPDKPKEPPKSNPELAQEKNQLTQREQALAAKKTELAQAEAQLTKAESAFNDHRKNCETIVKGQIQSGKHDGARWRRNDADPTGTVEALVTGKKVTFRKSDNEVKIKLKPVKNPLNERQQLEVQKTQLNQDFKALHQDLGRHQFKQDQFQQMSRKGVPPQQPVSPMSPGGGMEREILANNRPLPFPRRENEPPATFRERLHEEEIVPEQNPAQNQDQNQDANVEPARDQPENNNEFPAASPRADRGYSHAEVNQSREEDEIVHLSSKIAKTKKHIERLESVRDHSPKAKGGRRKKGHLSTQIDVHKESLNELEQKKAELLISRRAINFDDASTGEKCLPSYKGEENGN